LKDCDAVAVPVRPGEQVDRAFLLGVGVVEPGTVSYGIFWYVVVV
jgi:hypothetical protein